MENMILQLTIETLVQVLVPVFVGFILYLTKKAFDAFMVYLAQKGLMNDYEFAVAIIRELVLAAEQNGLTGAIQAEGEAKKDWVIRMAEKELSKHGIELDLDTIENLIESAVYEAFTEWKNEQGQ